MNYEIGQIFLAPMEGVIDGTMRALLTEINDFDFCITEFLRVVDTKLPRHMFYKIAPELNDESLTESGTPVRVQLLGQHPKWMAENAHTALLLGSKGIDLNFGCPAPTVNKSMGGAALLNFPEKIYDIITAVKEAASDSKQEVSVKIRLGFNEANLFNEIVDAINRAKPDLLTIHARTKRNGYRPPAYWKMIGDVRELNHIKTLANGEIWDRESAIRCMEDAKTSNIMIGRGALAMPNLANVIRFNQKPMQWAQLCELLIKYSTRVPNGQHQYYYSSRIKQWLKYLKIQYPEASIFFERIKRQSDASAIVKLLKQET